MKGSKKITIIRKKVKIKIIIKLEGKNNSSIVGLN